MALTSPRSLVLIDDPTGLNIPSYATLIRHKGFSYEALKQIVLSIPGQELLDDHDRQLLMQSHLHGDIRSLKIRCEEVIMAKRLNEQVDFVGETTPHMYFDCWAYCNKSQAVPLHKIEQCIPWIQANFMQTLSFDNAVELSRTFAIMDAHDSILLPEVLSLVGNVHGRESKFKYGEKLTSPMSLNSASIPTAGRYVTFPTSVHAAMGGQDCHFRVDWDHRCHPVDPRPVSNARRIPNLEEEVLWAKSHKQHNKEMHAIHGNTEEGSKKRPRSPSPTPGASSSNDPLQAQILQKMHENSQNT